jgi:hypothetical protein
MSVYETIKMSPLLGLQGSGGGLAYLAGLSGGDKTYVDDVFSTFLYTGDAVGGSDTQTINNGIDLAGEGGLVWIKNRSTNGREHILIDTERGATKYISSNQTSGESTGINHLNLFNNNGFRVGGDSTVNQNTNDFVSWTFRKAPGFFDVVTWTGNGTAGRTIAHSLGSVPGMVIVKRLSESSNWEVWHRSISNNQYLSLNNPWQAQSGGPWNNTTPTSTHFTVSADSDVNANNETYVAYIFAHDDASFGTDEDESIIKCGSYTGNGGIKAIDVGFEPQWFFMKNTTTGSTSWQTFDIMRGAASNSLDQPRLEFDSSGQEVSAYRTHATSTGFTIDNQSNDIINASGATYIYMAIRRPNKPPTAATEVFHTNYLASNGKDIKQITGFPIDLLLYHYGDAVNAFDRLRGNYRLRTPYNYAEGLVNPSLLDYSDGFKNESFNGSVSLGYSFKRAPGFFDIVAYQGTGSARTVNHNLKVKPELMIIKCRTDTRNWVAYSSYSTAEKFLQLDDPFGSQDSAELFNDTEPTATQFTVGTSNAVNNVNSTTGKYIAYLFATLPGISKIGSFTGTGNAINVDCGFTNGARFVLIKRADPHPTGAGSWYVWDTARGIVSGNDPYILLDSPVAQVTNTDYIDPLGTGFTVTSSAPAALNASGGNYLFFAIA